MKDQFKRNHVLDHAVKTSNTDKHIYLAEEIRSLCILNCPCNVVGAVQKFVADVSWVYIKKSKLKVMSGRHL